MADAVAPRLTLTVEDGALTSVPIWEDHKRGKNWLAVITSDPTAPGGIGRRFLPRANGRYYYLVAGLAVGQAVEFGADYVSGAGTRAPKRWYGVVVASDADSVTLDQYPSHQAIQVSKAILSARAHENAPV